MKSPALITSVLFDLDGTLLDTAPDLTGACNEALTSSGYAARSEEGLKPYISGGAAAMLRYAEPDLDDKPFSALLDRMLECYQQNIAQRTRFFDGMDIVLDELDGRGIPWGIVTNKSSRFTLPLLDAMNLTRRTPCIISGDSLPQKKPHPMPLLEACRILAASPGSSVYIGDARRDIEAGRNAGMYTLAACYGYVSADDPATAWGADQQIDQPVALIDWLNQQA
ncbi:HAD-IA family hydrolase [Candidatus Methylospira mobilis]|uniref:HAD-IA family hydrolase n=1 Tax=Candidatus Methylospira mobilis TaxID=1808979 RepID=A0A5Q0BPP5_9GAMM|nr:HAD-IA family hydrolase [Candidatus Methylospira mobilis]QFY43696.1 HAD-IA family hydrolase [Candidatus Methylospira mobilis]WNV04686.1 HAD-IA family hydrolase [Candidatus Methylospira mobilis]